MTHESLIVCRKELLEIFRDRRTLFFILMLPMAVIPLMTGGTVKYTEKMVKIRAVRTVSIAASPVSQDVYKNMIHDWFIESDIGSSLRRMNSPIFKAITGLGLPGVMTQAGRIPENVFRNPDALQEWAHDLALNSQVILDKKMRSSIDKLSSPIPATFEAIPQEVIDKARTFYYVAIQGLGLVEFVDPETLDEPPAGFHPKNPSDSLAAYPDIRKITWAIQQRRIQGFLEAPDFLRGLESDPRKSGTIALVHDSTIPLSYEARTRVNHAVNAYRDLIIRNRIGRLGHDSSILKPLRLRENMNLATVSEEVVAQIAGFLPYMIIMFSFVGGMSPAIDMGAGEKERQTLETLLLAGCSRTKLALGKFLAIFTANLTAALLSLISLGITLLTMVPDNMKEYLQIEFNLLHLGMIGLLMLPLAASFAGILLALSICARSAKEAQSYISPITILLILPGIATVLPDIEVSNTTAAIPLFNVSLLMREALKNEIYPAAYIIAMLSSVLFAAACLSFAVWQFRREQVLFRF